MRARDRSLHPDWPLLVCTIMLAAGLAGCVTQTPDPIEEREGALLEDRKVCEGTFLGGNPVHCEQKAARIPVYDEVPPGWVRTYTAPGPNQADYYRSVHPSDPPGTFRLGFSYDIQRGAIDREITLDPIHGVAWHASWQRPVFWESGPRSFVAFPEPVTQGSGPYQVSVFHPHVVGQSTRLFNVSIESPELHEKRLEPLWDVENDEFRIVHKIDGDGGPYYFHEGQPDTGVLGLSISQAGQDYSMLSRLFLLEGTAFGYTP